MIETRAAGELDARRLMMISAATVWIPSMRTAVKLS